MRRAHWHALSTATCSAVLCGVVLWWNVEPEPSFAVAEPVVTVVRERPWWNCPSCVPDSVRPEARAALFFDTATGRTVFQDGEGRRVPGTAALRAPLVRERARLAEKFPAKDAEAVVDAHWRTPWLDAASVLEAARFAGFPRIRLAGDIGHGQPGFASGGVAVLLCAPCVCAGFVPGRPCPDDAHWCLDHPTWGGQELEERASAWLGQRVAGREPRSLQVAATGTMPVGVLQILQEAAWRHGLCDVDFALLNEPRSR